MKKHVTSIVLSILVALCLASAPVAGAAARQGDPPDAFTRIVRSVKKVLIKLLPISLEDGLQPPHP